MLGAGSELVGSMWLAFISMLAVCISADSQFGQDEWVTGALGGNALRTYVDVGAHDGMELSNTAALDRMGWRGICIDPFLKKDGFLQRTCRLSQHAVSDRKTRASFTKYLGLSGITDLVMPRHLELMRNSSETEEVELETTLLGDLLDELQAPKFIDYLSLDTETALPGNLLDKLQAPKFIAHLSLDTEGSEALILRTFPFNRYAFGVITVEHNFEETKRRHIRNILEEHGYRFVRTIEVDDTFAAAPLAAVLHDPNLTE